MSTVPSHNNPNDEVKMTPEVREIVDDAAKQLYLGGNTWTEKEYGQFLEGFVPRIEAAVLAPYKTRTETAWPHNEIRKEKITMEYVDAPTAGMPSDERLEELVLKIKGGPGEWDESPVEFGLMVATAIRAEMQAEMARKQREAFEAAREKVDIQSMGEPDFYYVYPTYADYISQTGKEGE